MALSDFLNNFNNSKGSSVYVIDPSATFKVSFKYDVSGGEKSDETSNVTHEKTLGIKDLSPFVQKVGLPDFSVSTESIDTLVGSFITSKLFLTPDSHTFSMEFVNTKAPLLENWIYPWLREVTSPKWIYSGRPYTVATVTIDALDHSNVKYVLNGVRPASFPSMTLTHEVPSTVTRNVSFNFDFLYLQVDKKMIENTTVSQLKKLATSLAQKIGKTIGF